MICFHKLKKSYKLSWEDIHFFTGKDHEGVQIEFAKKCIKCNEETKHNLHISINSDGKISQELYNVSSFTKDFIKECTEKRRVERTITKPSIDDYPLLKELSNIIPKNTIIDYEDLNNKLSEGGLKCDSVDYRDCEPPICNFHKYAQHLGGLFPVVTKQGMYIERLIVNGKKRRICYPKDELAFIDSHIGLTQEQYDDYVKQGTIYVIESDLIDRPHIVEYLEIGRKFSLFKRYEQLNSELERTKEHLGLINNALEEVIKEKENNE